LAAVTPVGAAEIETAPPVVLPQANSSLDNVFGGLPRIASTQVPAGVAILGDWRLARLFVRESMRLDADRSGVSFTRNRVTLRAEGRYGIGYLRPQAFAVLDLTP
jgi:hypothetical protein